MQLLQNPYILQAFSLFVAVISVPSTYLPSRRVAFASNKGNTQDMSRKRAKMTILHAKTSIKEMEAMAEEMKKSAQTSKPFTESEIESAVASIKNLLIGKPFQNLFNEEAFTALVQDVAHQTHKDWEKTMTFSSRAQDIFLPSGAILENEESSALFLSIFERVLRDGNYNDALSHAKKRRIHEEDVNVDARPWVVLVTGLNGIRKTTTIYQPWFSTLLSEALIPPEGDPPNIKELPIGSNSFFRQLDHMIAVLANQQFARLYNIEQGASADENREAVDTYAKFKDAVFARYRTLSEMIGIIFCRECTRSRMNIMIETSGRDISMFNYVNTLFGTDSGYRKLVLRFTINDIHHAEKSVDRRMMEEMRRGMEILHDSKGEKEDTILRKVIDVNAGGPYGSAVLQGVQTDSDKVWSELSASDSSVTEGWCKASFKIYGSENDAWTASAIRSDGTLGTTFEFPLRK